MQLDISITTASESEEFIYFERTTKDTRNPNVTTTLLVSNDLLLYVYMLDVTSVDTGIIQPINNHFRSFSLLAITFPYFQESAEYFFSWQLIATNQPICSSSSNTEERIVSSIVMSILVGVIFVLCVAVGVGVSVFLVKNDNWDVYNSDNVMQGGGSGGGNGDGGGDDSGTSGMELLDSNECHDDGSFQDDNGDVEEEEDNNGDVEEEEEDDDNVGDGEGMKVNGVGVGMKRGDEEEGGKGRAGGSGDSNKEHRAKQRGKRKTRRKVGIQSRSAMEEEAECSGEIELQELP